MENLSSTYGSAHTRLRRLVAKAFTPRRVEGMRPTVEGIVADLLAGLGSEAPGTPADLKAGIGGEGVTLDDVFSHYTGDSLEAGGNYREISRARRTARRLG